MGLNQMEYTAIVITRRHVLFELGRVMQTLSGRDKEVAEICLDAAC
jgi:hypothetical protein